MATLTRCSNGTSETQVEGSSGEINLVTMCTSPESPQKKCPGVIILDGAQAGTINVSGCEIGVLYIFVNRSSVDTGVILQHTGGQFGARPIPQYGTGLCFCSDRIPAFQDLLPSDDGGNGVLLCG
eukprot:GEMP01101995.1.p1 GENE.GEMP01101995.1~~GEMP01101995.1.p1  ORF type:complete len:125 (+),score=19.48 GEMP01101995.1:166-540(+)